MTKEEVLDLIKQRIKNAEYNLADPLISASAKIWHNGYKTALEDILSSAR